MFDYPTSPFNILLIFVEGLSYDLIGKGKLPVFSELRNRGIFYKNFMSLQRQTNRGMYATLCGDYPNYLDTNAKMEVVLNRNLNLKCLPAVLKSKGYHSVFLQSNNLNFMKKGRFAKKIGFDEVFGERSFESAYARSNWGVDDRTLYRRALKMVDSLSLGSAPWLLTLLTVSTHHPYLVPGVPRPSVEQALGYANDTLSEFIHNLMDKGYLKNTMVIISSDEAAFRSGANKLEIAISQHHAPLLVLGGPVTQGKVSDDYFTQADILVSFVDLLGIDFKKGLGRSIFRRYTEDRSLFFGNVYTSQIFSYSSDGHFYVCDKNFDCEAYSTGRNFFDRVPIHRNEKVSEFAAILKDAFLYNDFTSSKVTAAEAELSLSLH